MKGNLKSDFFVVLGFGVAYLIVGVLYGIGIGGGKTVLICSIVSIVMAVIQVLEMIIDIYSKMEYKIIITMVCMLEAWRKENLGASVEEKKEKLDDFMQNQIIVENNIMKVTKPCKLAKNLLLLGGVVLFFLLMTYLNDDGNAKLADTLSIVSFSIIFISMAVQMSMRDYFAEIDQMIKSTIGAMEDENE